MATNNPGNTNQYSCTASTGGTVNGPNECVIIQSSTGSDNNATCLEKIGDPTGDAALRDLPAEHERREQRRRPAVGRRLRGACRWRRMRRRTPRSPSGPAAGSNNAQVNQDLKESQSASIGKTGTITQTQDGHQTAAVSQHSDSGNNAAKVLQSLQLKASATGGTAITQNQDTNGNGPNTSAAIYQNSDQDSGPITSTGTNNAYVFQSNDLNASGAKTGDLTQTQGEHRHRIVQPHGAVEHRRLDGAGQPERASEPRRESGQRHVVADSARADVERPEPGLEHRRHLQRLAELGSERRTGCASSSTSRNRPAVRAASAA